MERRLPMEMAASVIDFVFGFLALFLAGCMVVIVFSFTVMAVNDLRDDLKERKRKESDCEKGV